MTDLTPDPTLTPLRASDHVQFENALADLRSRLGASYGLLIGGEDLGARRLRTQHSPTDRGLVLGHFAAATEIEVGLAITAARSAAPAWANTSEADRRGVLRRVLVQFEARAYELAAVLTLEAGKTRHEALREVWGTTELISNYCDEWATHGFVPGRAGRAKTDSRMAAHGVWTVFAPFHHPLALGAAPAAAALLAGNTVVLKSAEENSWAARIFAELIREAGIPAGVFNLISGAPKDMGTAMFDDVRVAGTTFTGARSAGRPLSQMMWTSHPPRPCIAEFTAKSARIVTAHADVEATAVSIARAAFGLTGQRPDAPSYLVVHHEVADALIARLGSIASALRVGDPRLADTEIGPLVSADDHGHYRQVAHQLHEQGAHVLFGGETLSDHGRGAGHFVAPTLAEVARDGHPCWGRELLLPLLMLRRYRTPEGAIGIVRGLSRTSRVPVHGTAEEEARFARARAGTMERADPFAPIDATSAWSSMPASLRADEYASDEAPLLHEYLARYLRVDADPVAP